MVPDPIRLFHITAIDNLSAICRTGGLACKSLGAAQGIGYQNIAHAGAQGARAVKSVPNPPGGTIHSFVPFYFAPRSPMLRAIHGGRVPDCQLKQEDILYFETTIPRVMALGQDIVFYDRNATLHFSTPYTNTGALSTAIAWDLSTESPQLGGYCKYFQNVPENLRYVDRMEKRLAEFLVKNSVPLANMTDWYFLGQ